MTNARTVIVGGGQAAAQAALSLRQNGFDGRILLIGDENAPPYQRPPLSKKYLAREVDRERLSLRPAQLYGSNGIELRLSTTVVAMDRSDKRVFLSDGKHEAYDKLIIATGSRPRQFPGLTSAVEGVHYLRTQMDADRLSQELMPGRRILLVGGGYIGLEVAATARQLGASVILCEAADRLLARVAGTEVSLYFARLHRDNGTEIRLGCGLESVLEEGGRFRGVRLDTGEFIGADAAVIGIGAIPNDQIARESGLAVENGILVNEFQQTSDPDVFAIGDCANGPIAYYGRRYRIEAVQNAIDQAKTAAKAICGNFDPYRQIPWFWSDQFSTKFQAVGLIDGYDHVDFVESEAGGASASHFREGRLLGVQTIDWPSEFMGARKRMQQSFESELEEMA